VQCLALQWWRSFSSLNLQFNREIEKNPNDQTLFCLAQFKTNVFCSSGDFNVRGGNGGAGQGGAGAGGRIAVLCRWRYQYSGKFTDAGGLGAAASTGSQYALKHGAAAGT